MGKNKSVVSKTCYVMCSDVLNTHMKIHDKHVKVESPPSIVSCYLTPESGTSKYKTLKSECETILHIFILIFHYVFLIYPVYHLVFLFSYLH